MMFIVAKAFSSLLSPLPVIIAFLMTGVFLLWFTKKQRLGKILISVASLVLLFLSYGFVSDRLLEPLEYQYPPLRVQTNHYSLVKWIVVLGGGHTSNLKVPVTSRLSTASLVRLTEGVRLYREFPGSKIILSGGAVFDSIPEVEIGAKIAGIMDVKREDLVLEKISKDTEEQAQFIKNIVGNDLFILVTSASHMPRAMALFKKSGMDPLPAPTNYRVVQGQHISPGDFLPSTGALGKAETAIYEHMCFYWSKLRDRI